MMRVLRVIVITLVILGLDVSMLAVTCLRHRYQGSFEAYHSIFELQGDHRHSEDEAEEDCQLASADDHLLLTLAECKPCLIAEQALLPTDQPIESFIAELPLGVLKTYHSPPVKPPIL